MSNYPNSLPDLQDPEAGVKQGLSTPTHSVLHKQVNDEIEAIAAELGLIPKGAFASVSARLADIESGVASGETAFSWGNHSGLYSLVDHTHTGVYQPVGSYLTSLTAGHGIDIQSSNEIIVDETELDSDLIPFSASGITATTVHDAIVELKSDISVGDQTSVVVTAVPSSDVSAEGIKIILTAAENMAFGDVGYIASTGKVAIGDASAIATASCVVMATASISADAAGTFLLMGIARNDAWNWTVGGLIYLTITGTTGNTLSQTAPTATDEVIQILGIATHADRVYFNPSLSQVEHA